MDSNELLIVITDSQEILVPKKESMDGIKCSKRRMSVSSMVNAHTKTKQRECKSLTEIENSSTEILTKIQNQSSENLLSISHFEDPFPRRFSDVVLSSRNREAETGESIRRRSKSFNSVAKERSGKSAQALGRKWLSKTLSIRKWIKKESVAAAFMPKCLSYSSPLLPRQPSPAVLEVG